MVNVVQRLGVADEDECRWHVGLTVEGAAVLRICPLYRGFFSLYCRIILQRQDSKGFSKHVLFKEDSSTE